MFSAATELPVFLPCTETPAEARTTHLALTTTLETFFYQYATCSQNHCAILANYWCLGRTGLIWEASEIPQTDDDSIWWPSPGQGTQLNTSIPQPVLNTHAWAHKHTYTVSLIRTHTHTRTHTHLWTFFPMHICISLHLWTNVCTLWGCSKWNSFIWYK